MGIGSGINSPSDNFIAPMIDINNEENAYEPLNLYSSVSTQNKLNKIRGQP